MKAVQRSYSADAQRHFRRSHTTWFLPYSEGTNDQNFPAGLYRLPMVGRFRISKVWVNGGTANAQLRTEAYLAAKSQRFAK